MSFTCKIRKISEHSTLSWHLIWAVILFVLALAVYGVTLAPTITWSHDGGDGGDLITAVHTLGLAHPPGYPTYILMGRLFSLLPWEDTAYKLNLMSAVFSALTITLFYLIAVELSPSSAPRLAVLIIPVVAALGLAFSPVFWSQALITEVYGLNAFFVAVVLWLLVRWRRSHTPALLILLGFIYGLSLGNHLTMTLLIPPIALLLWRERHHLRLALLGAVVLSLLVGLSIYLYLPLRAAQNPPLNWGNPQTLQQFLWVVSASLYRHFVFALPWDQVPTRLSAWATLLIKQFGWWGLFLGLTGAWHLRYRDRSFSYLSWLAFILYTAYAIGYNTTDSYVYLIPTFMFFALWLGGGLSVVLSYLADVWPKTGAAVWVGCGLALAMPVLSLGTNFATTNLSQDRTAHDFGREIMAALPAEAIALTNSDQHTFTLWYFQYVVTGRMDLVIVDEALLPHRWYRESLHLHHPDLRLPDTADLTDFIMANIDQRIIYTVEEDQPLLADDSGPRQGLLHRVRKQDKNTSDPNP